MSDPDIFQTMPMPSRVGTSDPAVAGDFIALILAATQSASRSSDWFERNPV